MNKYHMQTAGEAGAQMGRHWVGPNGDGSMGALSAAFIREAAEQFVAGHRFVDLIDGPTPDENRAANEFVQAFYYANSVPSW